MDLGLGYRI